MTSSWFCHASCVIIRTDITSAVACHLACKVMQPHLIWFSWKGFTIVDKPLSHWICFRKYQNIFTFLYNYSRHRYVTGSLNLPLMEHKYSFQRAKFMRPTWGPPGSCDPRGAPCWPHEPCYPGTYGTDLVFQEYFGFSTTWLIWSYLKISWWGDVTNRRCGLSKGLHLNKNSVMENENILIANLSLTPHIFNGWKHYKRVLIFLLS